MAEMDRNQDPNEGRDQRGFRPASRPTPMGYELAGIGVQFGVTILVFVFVGVWLDRHFGSSPWFTIGCTFVGAGGGMYSMYRRAMAAERRQSENRK